MKAVQKLLVAIAILALVTSVSIANQNGSNLSENSSNAIETQIVDNTNIQETNLTIEEIKIIKELINEGKLKSRDKPLNIIERMRNAKVPSELIPSDITNITKSNVSDISATINIAYSNPISGISAQGTDFSNTIYTNDYVNWASWGFYLPENSYTYIDTSGNVNGFKDGKNYIMNVDNSQYTNWAYDSPCSDTGWFSIQPNCNQELQRSKLFYLNKGWHTVNLDGYANRYGSYYSVFGSISILAFPEYTAIRVDSPNGGENWAKGTTKSITWTKYGQSGANVKIELYKAGVLNSVISTITPNDGVYSWYIPSFQPIGTDYKIKITSTSDTKYNDWSNNNFRIY